MAPFAMAKIRSGAPRPPLSPQTIRQHPGRCSKPSAATRRQPSSWAAGCPTVTVPPVRLRDRRPHQLRRGRAILCPARPDVQPAGGPNRPVDNG